MLRAGRYKNMCRNVLFPTLVLALSAGVQSVPARSAPDDVTAYVERVRDTFQVPGMAVAVIQDGRIVFADGFGQLDLTASRTVDSHTLFCIASLTKPITATAVEMLAEQGKLSMNDRVIDHLPDFRMSEPYATHEMRVRDLLAHRSGLGSHAGDLLFVPETTYTAQEVVGRLRALPLTSGFRSSFAYENIMFAVASQLIEQASGERYGDYIRHHIFDPTGMADSRIDHSELLPGDDVATAYADRDGSLTAIPTLTWKNNPGAAGIYSSIDDMARWAQMQLAAGVVGKQRLFSAATQQRMWSMLTPIDIEPAPVPSLQAAQPNFFGYAEGWYVSDYRGERMVWHTGEFPGMFSRVTLLPERGLGIVVLLNQESEAARSAITLQLLDRYLGLPASDWIAAYESARALERRRLDSLVPAPPARPGIAQVRPFSTYAGIYRDAWYGDVRVERAAGGLRMRFLHSPRLLGSLVPQRADTFLVRWDDRTLDADALVEFTTDRRGAVTGARMSRASPTTAHAYDYQDLRLFKRKNRIAAAGPD
jgi:CubicO group peptidase (beta-lactamase class C family)